MTLISTFDALEKIFPVATGGSMIEFIYYHRYSGSINNRQVKHWLQLTPMHLGDALYVIRTCNISICEALTYAAL